MSYLINCFFLFCLTESAKKIFFEEKDKEVNEDFSPDVSEYLPSPNRLANLENFSKTPSTIGGDSDYITEATHNISNTPSTISNISVILNPVDFTASASVVYENRQISDVDKIHCDGITYKRLTSPYTGHNYTETLYGKSTKKLTRRCLNYNILAVPKNVNANHVSSGLVCVQEDGKQKQSIMASTSSELTLNSQYIFQELDTCELDETLKPENFSDDGDSTLIQRTVVSNKDMSTCSNLDITNLLQTHLNEDNAENNFNSLNEDTHERDSALVSKAVSIELETTITSLEDETTTGNVISTAKKLTRKRIRNESDRQDQKSKRLKNSGEAYVGCRSKKEFKKKTVKAECKCTKKCGERITRVQREALLQQYYELGDHELQWRYIANHTIAEDVKRITVVRKNNRTQSIKYYFHLDGEKMQVCKTFFINTLSISHQTVYTALEKNKSDIGLIDNRGHHDNRPRKMHVKTEENIFQHIQLFPAVESHYVRKDSTRQYLSELLTVSKMYRLYQTWVQEGNYDCPVASKRQYETIFNTKFNYSFFRPKKDQCSTCTLYRDADPVRQETLQEKYDKHQKNKDRVRQIKKQEKESIDPSHTTIAIFDLEKVLNIPQSQVGIFHYKRKYPIYNFTVFDSTRLKGHCYVWHYTIAKRGAVEIGSCLWQFLLSEKERGITTFSFYSDGCAGQNKNRFIFALYMFAAQELQINITHRFFETGHGQSEGDSMHSSIERELKHRVVYTPEQMYAIIMNAKVTGEKYNVKEMLQSEFFNIKELIKNKNWVKDEEGQKITWSKIMEVSILHSQPHILRFKYDFDAEYSQLNVEQHQRLSSARSKRSIKQTDRQTSRSVAEFQLQLAYTEPLPLSKALHEDLMSLCRSKAIPVFYHAFYESLTYDSESHTLSIDNEDQEN